METIIYTSPKKYIIIDIKKLLNENNIPVSSIQLYIAVHTREGRRERRGELTVPIEEFDEQLNDAETLEIYVEEEYHDKAFKLIEEWVSKNYYKYCIYKSYDYDEADTIQRLLIKNDIPCDDVYTHFLEDDTEEYLILLDPALHEQANNLLGNNYKPSPSPEPAIIETHYKKDQKNKIYEQEIKENVLPRNILITLLIIITISFLLYRFKDSVPIVDKTYNMLIEWLNNIKGVQHDL